MSEAVGAFLAAVSIVVPSIDLAIQVSQGARQFNKLTDSLMPKSPCTGDADGFGGYPDNFCFCISV